MKELRCKHLISWAWGCRGGYFLVHPKLPRKEMNNG